MPKKNNDELNVGEYLSLSFIWNNQRRNIVLAILLLVVGLVTTLFLSIYFINEVEDTNNHNLSIIVEEVNLKIDTRLHAHAQLLRSQASWVRSVERVTREDWNKVYTGQKLEKNLPGILGLGYSVIIPNNKLKSHEKEIQDEGFPGYKVHPQGNRPLYTSIIYLEPFAGRNLRAFGYDMFSEPVRRKAMETARDYDLATLSKKITLVQEMEKDVQAGTLMYVPVYKKNMPINNIEQRRKAIIGWVYSPYRMNDLMDGILEDYKMINERKIILHIYDSPNYSDKELLYCSELASNNHEPKPNSLLIKSKIIFNHTEWYLTYSQQKEHLLSESYSKVWLTLLFGIIITFSLFLLYLSLLSVKLKAKSLLKLTAELKESKDRYENVFINAPFGIFNSKLNGEIITCNPAFTKMLGYNNAEEMKGKNLSDHIYYDYFSREEILNTIKKSDGWIAFEEIKWKCKNGNMITVFLNGRKFIDNDGNILYLEGFVQDITEQNNALKNLQISEIKYKTLFQNLPIGITISDKRGKIKECNKESEKILLPINEQTTRDISGDVWNIVRPDGSRMASEEFASVIALNENRLVENVEMGIVKDNGEITWINVTAAPIPLDNYGVAIAYIDITEKKKAEESVVLSEARLKRAEIASKSGNWELHLDTKIITASEGAQLIYGINKSLIDYEIIKGIPLREYRQLLDEAATNLILNDVPYEIEFKIQSLDTGEIKDIFSFAVFDKAKRIIFGVIQDITFRKKIEEALRNSRERFMAIANYAASWEAWFSPKGELLWMNHYCSKLTGYTPQEYIDSPNFLTMAIAEEDLKLVLEKFNLALSGFSGENLETRVNCKDGSKLWVSISWTPIYDANGKNLGFRTSSKDITERKESELRLKEYAEELQIANDTKDKFFSIISHDLRSPFFGLIGLSEILADEEYELTSEEKNKIAKDLNNAIHAQYDLLVDLLNWARIQNKNFTLKLEQIYLVKIVDGILDNLHAMAEQKSILLLNKVNDDVKVYADENMLKLIIRNLIANAIKFTNIKGTIQITSKTLIEYIEIRISDNGVGMSEETVAQLFSSEKTISTDGTRKEKGTGLGLVLCKEIVEKHNGKIWVESKIKEGSTFVFTLPIAMIDNSSIDS